MTNQQSFAAAETAEQAWPTTDFLVTACALRRELEAAARCASDCSSRVANIEKAAFDKALPAAMLAGGADKLAKLGAEQDAANLAVTQKRAALRLFLETERAKFFSLRAQELEHLRAGMSERFARAQKAAAELCAALVDLLGTEAECARQEKLIGEWNRAVKTFNRTIPTVNPSAIPGGIGIASGESIRTQVEGMLLADKNVRQLCRDFLTAKAQQRERAAELEEAKIAQAEVQANPISVVEPF